MPRARWGILRNDGVMTMENLVAVAEGAEAFVELLNANGVDYIFLNPGTELAPVQEALSKFKALGKRTPEVVLCLHESVAMAAVHGPCMVSGRPRVVLVLVTDNFHLLQD